MVNRMWTNKETQTAVAMFVNGKTYTEIAKALRRSRSEIAGKLNRLGIRRNGPPIRSKKPRDPRPPKPPPPKIVARSPQVPSQPPSPPQRHSPAPLPSLPPPRPPGPPCCWELGYNDCRFPVGRRGEDGPTTFCAKPVEPGTSWCPDHHAVVYTKRLALR